MKMPLGMAYAIVPILALVLMTGCGGSRSSQSLSDPGATDDPEGTSDSGDTAQGKTFTLSDSIFFDAIQEVTPVFGPSAAASVSPLAGAKAASLAWGSGNPIYELFYLLQEFDPATDQGVIDTSNLYKTMWETIGFIERTRRSCSAISAQVIASPFDFGSPPTSYDCTFNQEAANGYDFGGALNVLDASGNSVVIEGEQGIPETAALIHGLFGFVWTGGGHNEYGVFEGTYDVVTNDLAGSIAVWVDYEGANDYCYRNDVVGNSATHFFTLRAAKGNRVGESQNFSIVGKGYSQGEGNYFLMKMPGVGPAAQYYCIEAGDGEEELKVIDGRGSDAVDPECEQYQADVDALVHMTTADLACDTSDFNPDGTGLAAEGTIFLEYR